MEFNWRNSREKMLADEAELAQLDYDTQKAHEMDQLIQANANATRAYKLMELGDQLNSSEAMADVQKTLLGQKEMEAQQEEAERQRWLELEKQDAERKARIHNDPRMQIAAMMAMGGQPGALSSLLASSVQQDYQKAEKAKSDAEAAQKQMDALENGIKTDITLLAGMNKVQRKKVLDMSKPLFFSNMEKLIAQGAKPNLSMAQWTSLFGDFESEGDAALTRAQMQKEFDRLSVKNNRTPAEDKRMAYLANQLRKK